MSEKLVDGCRIGHWSVIKKDGGIVSVPDADDVRRELDALHERIEALESWKERAEHSILKLVDFMIESQVDKSDQQKSLLESIGSAVASFQHPPKPAEKQKKLGEYFAEFSIVRGDAKSDMSNLQKGQCLAEAAIKEVERVIEATCETAYQNNVACVLIRRLRKELL